MLKIYNGDVTINGSRIDLFADYCTLSRALIMKEMLPAEALRLSVEIAERYDDASEIPAEMLIRFLAIMDKHSSGKKDSNKFEDVIKNIIFGKE